MPISSDNRLVFVHIPKTAGSSIEEVLQANELPDYFGKRVAPATEVSLQHLYLSELEQELDLQDLKIFTVVRNPFDRIVSTYHHHKDKKGYTSWLFEDFVNHALNKENRRTFFDGHLEPQVNYVKSLKGYKCKIFRFEELHKVTVWLSEQLQKTIDLPHHRKSDRLKDYRDYYSSESLKSLVASHYTEDIARFNYSF
jgi:hypothetical protein